MFTTPGSLCFRCYAEYDPSLESCPDCAEKPALKFKLAILNEDGSIADTIETDDMHYDTGLQELEGRVNAYIAEGYDALSMASEPNPARYGAS